MTYLNQFLVSLTVPFSSMCCRAGKPGLYCGAAGDNGQRVSKSVLLLIAIATLLVSNLHSPSTLHAQQADAHDHPVLVEDHDVQVADPEPGTEQGTVAHDHHGPAATTLANSQFVISAPSSADVYLRVKTTALAAWSTAPPTEPPAA